ncbi:single-stranded DNA-binding protein [Hymenobacter sp. 15J16-1T3B]|uniref:single-stranded DNA-binding protein n=1 Tax=Hymenobacter sp. 15J16-1T3B TaxID=2886941 RepID=UPI001D119256|nr:single-stranded DNA-binding protein [Hymenobacter sp. 15J16-1T3B]MCC3155657.1 single-stranded DNA-binding protein [Hymenobacter sp. 15J16-1T3B]
MSSVNKVILIGNLGTDPEVRHLESGAAVAQFRLATNEFYKDKQGNRVERTEWHNIVAWRGLAEMVEKYVKKGQSIYVEGKIRTRQYQDKDQQTRYVTEIVADEITMLGGRGQGEAGNAQQGGAQATPAEQKTFRQEAELNELPF